MLSAIVANAVGLQAAYVEKLPNSTVEFKMVPVPAGEVKVGGKAVKVKPFFMATTETTWDMFDLYWLSGEPSKPYDQTKFGPDAIARPSRSYNLPDLGWGHWGYPVINVSSETAEMFCRWLRSATKKNYRLPTEAEWQWAAQEAVGGDWALAPTEITKREWTVENTAGTTKPVGKRTANKLGLFDMLGNTGEWALDVAGKPVLCGGDFGLPAEDIKPTLRRYWSPMWQDSDPQIPKSRWWLSDGSFVGFRVVRDAP